MSLSELAYRAQQEAAKVIERLSARDRYPDPLSLLRYHAPGVATPEAALRLIRAVAPGRFFAGAGDAMTLAALRERLPDQCAELISGAREMAVSRRFDLLGYRMLSFGNPIDWHLDPIWGRRSPRVHWSGIDAFDASMVGDSKIIWELNRHQWIVTLAQAWSLTRDEWYAAACIRAIDSWLDANPPGTGINWTSSLEVAIRLISWCWILVLLRDLPSLSGTWTMKALSAIWLHAAHVSRHPSYYSSPNTHLTGEALGLVYAGVVFDECGDAARWRRTGTRILVGECARQIFDDGVHFEQSTCYHRYTIEIYLHFLLLAARNGLTIPSSVAASVERMVDFLLSIRQPDGSIPAVGDADGGTLLPLSRRAPNSAAGLFAIGATVFRRPEFAWAADGIAPEVFWLLGPSGLSAFDALRPNPPAGPTSRVFPRGGYAVMRNAWVGDAHQMIVDIGRLGCPISGGHGHADLLAVQCSMFGEPCLIDAGNYCYTTEQEWRDFFRGSAAHATVLVDGRSQAEPAGPFRWRRRPQVRLRQWESSPDLDFLDAEHDAFSRPADPLTHRRRVLFVKPRYWVLVDDLIGRSSHHVELTFQFGPLPVAFGPGPWARADTSRGPVLWVRSFAATPVLTTIKSGQLRPIRGWIAPTYGERLPAPSLIQSASVVLPWRVLTLLYPDADGASSPPAIRLMTDGGDVPSGLCFERSGEAVHVEERAPCRVRPGTPCAALPVS